MSLPAWQGGTDRSWQPAAELLICLFGANCTRTKNKQALTDFNRASCASRVAPRLLPLYSPKEALQGSAQLACCAQLHAIQAQPPGGTQKSPFVNGT
jgi:hypothetical protein